MRISSYVIKLYNTINIFYFRIYVYFNVFYYEMAEAFIYLFKRDDPNVQSSK